jgi:hypothetical protein
MPSKSERIDRTISLLRKLKAHSEEEIRSYDEALKGEGLTEPQRRNIEFARKSAERSLETAIKSLEELEPLGGRQ